MKSSPAGSVLYHTAGATVSASKDTHRPPAYNGPSSLLAPSLLMKHGALRRDAVIAAPPLPLPPPFDRWLDEGRRFLIGVTRRASVFSFAERRVCRSIIRCVVCTLLLFACSKRTASFRLHPDLWVQHCRLVRPILFRKGGGRRRKRSGQLSCTPEREFACLFAAGH